MKGKKKKIHCKWVRSKEMLRFVIYIKEKKSENEVRRIAKRDLQQEWAWLPL